MDERKRGFDVAAELNDQKRPRPSADSIGFSPSDVVSKICLSRGDFGKVIGKGGQTIANIRGKCGAAIKGTEVSEEKRLVFLLFASFGHHHRSWSSQDPSHKLSKPLIFFQISSIPIICTQPQLSRSLSM
jgi:predicted RNA-binding protein YlqC (UPF0109 family)